MSLPFNQNANPVPVYFARVPETPQNQPYEPQRVRILENAAATVMIDNTTRVSGSPFKFRVVFTQSVQNIKRIAVAYAQFSPICGNINRKNNTLRVVVTTGGSAGTYTFILTPGYYPTGASVVAMMNPILNAGLPGFTIAWNAITQSFTFTYNGIDLFYVDPTCPFIRYGGRMWAFPINSTPQAIKTGEWAQLRFTNQIIVRSQRFTQYEKNNSSGSDPKTGAFFTTATYGNLCANEGASDESRLIEIPYPFPTYRTYESQTQITDADIEILDEWGDDPETYTDSPTTWLFRLAVVTNV